MLEVSHSFSYSLLRIKGNRKFLNNYSNSGGNFSDLKLVLGHKISLDNETLISYFQIIPIKNLLI